MKNKLIVGFIVFLGIIIAYSYMYPDHRTISEEIVGFNVKLTLYLMNLLMMQHKQNQSI